MKYERPVTVGETKGAKSIADNQNLLTSYEQDITFFLFLATINRSISVENDREIYFLSKDFDNYWLH